MIEVIGVKLPQHTSIDLYDSYTKYTSDEKRVKLKKLHSIDDKIRTLVADLLARFMLSKELNVKVNDIIINLNDFGKPEIKTGPSDKKIHFNCSHSNNWVLCGVCEMPIGVDIEKVTDIDISICKRIFTPLEISYLDQKESFDQKNVFFTLWTLKESYLKWDGRGLSLPMRDFSVIHDDNEIRIESNYYSEKCFIKSLDFEDNYKVAICTTHSYDISKIRKVDLSVFFKEFEMCLSGDSSVIKKSSPFLCVNSLELF